MRQIARKPKIKKLRYNKINTKNTKIRDENERKGKDR